MTKGAYKNEKTEQLLSNRIKNPDVAAKFKPYPKLAKETLRLLRQMIIEAAATIKEVGALEETLKWGEPSYLTAETKVGSTIRIDWKKNNPDCVFIYFKCTSNLVETFKQQYPDTFVFGGNRSIMFKIGDQIPHDELKICIFLALTYHLNKKLPVTQRLKLIEKLTAL